MKFAKIRFSFNESISAMQTLKSDLAEKVWNALKYLNHLDLQFHLFIVGKMIWKIILSVFQMQGRLLPIHNIYEAIFTHTQLHTFLLTMEKGLMENNQ